jgi:uncharacterized protein (TIGR02453 family)
MATKNTFPGFPVEGIAFLRNLKKHNDRDWFTPRKAVFEETVKKPMIELVGAIHREMLRFAPDYVGEPAKCVYRIYRDTRFSKDKTPYKTYASALFLRNGFDKYSGCAGYYFAISPENIEVAGGVYTPDRDVLQAVRQHIAANHKDFRKAFETAKIRKLFSELSGDSLTRVPKGFDADHPAADLLRRKHYLLDARIEPALATTPKLLREIVTRIEAMTPFIEFLNDPLLKRHAKERQKRQFLA